MCFREEMPAITDHVYTLMTNRVSLDYLMLFMHCKDLYTSVLMNKTDVLVRSFAIYYLIADAVFISHNNPDCIT